MKWDEMRYKVADVIADYVHAAIREDRRLFLAGIKDCMEPALFLEIEQAVNRNNVLGKRIDPARAERERICKIADSLGIEIKVPGGKLTLAGFLRVSEAKCSGGKAEPDGVATAE